jgi:transposase InsO family protein
MRLMPIYQKPNTSKPAKGHKTYPYLLGGLRIDRPNQVWCSDITYLHAWETGSQARAGVGRWITFYNHQRPHAAHGGQPPAMVYFNATQTDQQVQAVA